jgi:hypothetical protein
VRVNFALREDGRLRPEALDHTAKKWPYILRGHQDRRLAFAASLLETFANERDKFREARGAISTRTCSASITGLREPAMLSAMPSRR